MDYFLLIKSLFCIKKFSNNGNSLLTELSFIRGNSFFLKFETNKRIKFLSFGKSSNNLLQNLNSCQIVAINLKIRFLSLRKKISKLRALTI
ncbi:hypothetical protein BpHYR1_014398 [Brachionus plicatilis]|uniref:Uncharacterized protein n=1 Tax=Brachionus plicatilis TaxID=10195 RepID=A0A3M7R1V2_BRAPC|nr:hypothetical protein BpHYR1_014398 [Brachionus plicatilis]